MSVCESGGHITYTLAPLIYGCEIAVKFSSAA